MGWFQRLFLLLSLTAFEASKGQDTVEESCSYYDNDDGAWRSVIVFDVQREYHWHHGLRGFFHSSFLHTRLWG